VFWQIELRPGDSQEAGVECPPNFPRMQVCHNEVRVAMVSAECPRIQSSWAARVGILFVPLLTAFPSRRTRAASRLAPFPFPKGRGPSRGSASPSNPASTRAQPITSIGFKVPPGTAGHVPGLRITYEGGGGNGPLGYGWSLPHELCPAAAAITEFPLTARTSVSLVKTPSLMT